MATIGNEVALFALMSEGIQGRPTMFPDLNPNAEVFPKEWGFYINFPFGEHFRRTDGVIMTKILVIKPFQRFSLQRHFQRSERWLILSPSLMITLENDHKIQDIIPSIGSSIDVPIQRLHRAHNLGTQSGLIYEEMFHCYSEDDIERIQDDYGRTR